LLAASQLKPRSNLSKEGNLLASVAEEAVLGSESTLDPDPLEESSKGFRNEYMQLQLRIFMLTLVLTVFAVLISAIFFDFHAAISLLIGALSGILYLRLLARGIEKLGKTSMSVSKIQLLVPVVLFFLVSQFQQLELLPALLGFLLYKPSLIVQFLLKP
tara:strand:+ start:403 stop:879 length:477 start_codon:yes stop_codon:yes gene_type:complete